MQLFFFTQKLLLFPVAESKMEQKVSLKQQSGSVTSGGSVLPDKAAEKCKRCQECREEIRQRSIVCYF